MTTISLRVKLITTGAVKTMPFLCTMSVFEANQEIRDKLGEIAGGGDHSLYLPSTRIWLDVVKQLQFYELRSNDTVEFRKRHRQIRVRLLDGTNKTVLMDDSQPVKELVKAVCEKLGVANPEEYSFCVQISGDKDKKKETKFKGSEDNIIWLHPEKFLSQQDVHEGNMVVLKKKFHFSDANIDRTDPVQLNLLYVQARDAIVGAKYPVTLAEAVQFAAIQRQVQSGTTETQKAKSVNVKECLPHEYWKVKDIDKRIVAEHGKLMGMTELNAKFRYVQLCRSLRTYGVTFFLVKEKDPKSKRMQPRLLGVAKDAVMRFDVETKECLKSWPLTSLRRWAASPNSFTLDFGDYEDAYYNAMTNEGEHMSQIIAGYIDIILKRKKFADKSALSQQPQTMAITEEVLAPARGKAVITNTIQASKAVQRPLTQQAVMVDGPERFAHSQSQTTARRLVTAHTFGSQGKGEITAMVGSQHAVHHKLKIGSATTEAACLEMESLDKAALPEITDAAEREKWRKNALLANVQVVQAQCVAHLASTAAVLNATDLNLDDKQLEAIGGEINTLTTTLPLVTGNVKSISMLMGDPHKGEAMLTDARNFGSATLQYLNSIQAMVSSTSTKPADLYGPAQAVSATALKLMEALDCATVSKKQRDYHLDETKAVSKNIQSLVAKAQAVVNTLADPEGQMQLMEAVKQCATSTSRAVVAASVVSPVLPSPICMAQLDAARESVLNKAEIIVDTEEKFQPDASKRLLRTEFEAVKRSLNRLAHVSRNIDSCSDQPNNDRVAGAAMGVESGEGILQNALAVAFEVVSFEESVDDGERRRALTAEVANLSKAVKEVMTLENSAPDISETVHDLSNNVQQLLAMASDYKQSPNNVALADEVYAELGKTFNLVGQLLNRDVSDELDERLLGACKNCITSTAFTVGACTLVASQEKQDQHHGSAAERAINDALTASSALILATQEFKQNRGDEGQRTTVIEKANTFLDQTQTLREAADFLSSAIEDALLKRQLANAVAQFSADAKCLRHITKTLGLYEKAHIADDLQTRVEDLRKAIKTFLCDSHTLLEDIPLAQTEFQLVCATDDILRCVEAVEQMVEAPECTTLPEQSRDMVAKLETLANLIMQLVHGGTTVEDSNGENEPTGSFQRNLMKSDTSNNALVRHVDDLLVHASHVLKLSKLAKKDNRQLHNFKKRVNGWKGTLREIEEEYPSRRSLRNAALAIANCVREAQYGMSFPSNSGASDHDTASSLNKIIPQLSASATSVTMASKNVILACHRSSTDLATSAQEIADAVEDLVDLMARLAHLTQDERLIEHMMDDLVELSSNAIHLLDTAKTLSGRAKTAESKKSLVEGAGRIGQNMAQIVHRCSSAIPAIGEFTAALHNIRQCYDDIKKVGERPPPYTAHNSERRASSETPAKESASYPELLETLATKSTEFNDGWVNVLNVARSQDIPRMSKAVLTMSQRVRDMQDVLNAVLTLLLDSEQAGQQDEKHPTCHSNVVAQRSLSLIKAAEELALLAQKWGTQFDNAATVHALNVSGRTVANYTKVLSRVVRAATPGVKETEEALDKVQVMLATLDGIMTQRMINDMEPAGSEKGPSVPRILELLEDLRVTGKTFVADTDCDIKSRPKAVKSLNTLVDSYGCLIATLFKDPSASTTGVDLQAIKTLGDSVLHAARHCQESNLSTAEESFKLQDIDVGFEPSLTALNASLTETLQLYKPIRGARQVVDDAKHRVSSERHDSPLENACGDINADKALNETVTRILKSSKEPAVLADLAQELAHLTVSYTYAVHDEMRKQNVLVAHEKSPSWKILEAATTALQCIQNSAFCPNEHKNQSTLSKACRDLSKELRDSVQFMQTKGDACSKIIDDIVDHIIQPIDVQLVESEVRGTSTEVRGTSAKARGTSLDIQGTSAESASHTRDVSQSLAADQGSREQARTVAEKLKVVISATGESVDRVTEASADVYDALVDLKRMVTEITGTTEDASTREKLMETTKIIASQSADLLQYASKCSGAQSRTEADVQHLAVAASEVGASITALYKALDDANEAVNRHKANVRTLEATVEGVHEVKTRIMALDPSATLSIDNDADEEVLAEMVSGTKTLAALATDLVSHSANAKVSPEELAIPCQGLVTEANRLTTHMEQVWAGPGIKNERRMMKVASEKVCEELVMLLPAMGSENSKDRSGAIRSFASSVQNLVSVMTNTANEASKYQEARRETDQAQKELNAAARSIEAAAAKLYELQREREEARLKAAQEKEDAVPIDKDFHECLLDAARSIADASATLVRSAKKCQRDIKSGPGQVATSGNEMYFDDGTWTEGLVSAARTVVLATQDLCHNTNTFVKGSGSCELVIASAREVSAATTRLITAASARVDPESSSQIGLREAGRRVQQAAEQLVKAAQQFMQIEDEAPASDTEENTQVVTGRREMALRVSELEAQAEILRLEKELEKARNKLANLRRTKYKQGSRKSHGPATNVCASYGVGLGSKGEDIFFLMYSCWQFLLFILREGAF